MNKKFISLQAFIILICQLSFILAAHATQTIEDLVNQDKLTISLDISQNKQQIVGQAIILAIEISTDRWFATGSTIQDFSLKDVVMQANNTTTINGNKRINGQTWATQTHEITLYPTASGAYQVPPIKVNIAVNTEGDGIISGVLSTQENSFTIELPQALESIENFIVSSQVTLSIDGFFDEDKDYAIGEAITQTITITASDTPAMMITPVNLITHNLISNNKLSSDKMTNNNTTLDGVSIYHKPAKVFDKSNRGTLLGTRVESFTYIFEKSGRYVIDEQVIHWWNSQTSTLERLLIPSSTWNVSDKGLSNISASNNFQAYDVTIETVIYLVIAILLLIIISIGFIKRQYLSSLFNKVTKREQRLLRREFLNAVSQKSYLVATQYLYQYALLQNKQTFTASCSESITLNKLAFNIDNAKAPLSFSLNQAEVLINKIDANTFTNKEAANFTPNERINLNSE